MSEPPLDRRFRALDDLTLADLEAVRLTLHGGSVIDWHRLNFESRQDVEDFMGSKMGRAIVANSSMQLLLKQSSSAVDVLADVFKLTEEERKRLANFPVGQGLFFAGQNHVHIQIIASQTEQALVTTGAGAAGMQQQVPNDQPVANAGYMDPGPR